MIIAAFAVVAVAIAFRLPSCGESFWLDELHSAWSVSDGFGAVGARAAAGNQTTGYFHLLWIWSAIFGQGEMAMRLSSVLASGLAVGFLVVGVSLRTGRVAAGVVAGGVLAVDSNGIFFGCELRPYALVTLCAVLAVWSMMIWIGGEQDGVGQTAAWSRRSDRAGRWRLSMLFWICIAALVHPTSLGVLWMLAPAAFFAAWMKSRLHLWRGDLVAGLFVVATLGLLVMSSLPDSWQRRDLWKAFGQANDWWQLWWAWSWVPIVIVPVAAAGLAWMAVHIITWVSPERDADLDRVRVRWDWVGMIPGFVGLIGTVEFFCASYYGWVPLWHRRYFIAALPLLAWSAGEWSAICLWQLHRGVQQLTRVQEVGRYQVGKHQVGVSVTLGMVVVTSIIGFQLWYQGTLQTLAGGRLPVQLRGEHWREAVATIREERRAGELVWLDSDLIETGFLRQSVSETEALTEAQWDYLKFPLDGPYWLDPAVVVVVASGEHESWMVQQLAMLPKSSTTVWLVCRSSRRSAEQMIGRLNQFRRVSAVERFSGRPFVLRLTLSE
jgi:hypothetical protein